MRKFFCAGGKRGKENREEVREGKRKKGRMRERREGKRKKEF